MKNLLLDTHIILWSAAQPERIPTKLAKAMTDPAIGLWFSPVSVWEILVLAEKGRVWIGDDREKSVRYIFQSLPLREAPLNKEVAIHSRTVDVPHQDPADRFLLATAMVYGLTLVTADKRLLATKKLPTLSAIK